MEPILTNADCPQCGEKMTIYIEPYCRDKDDKVYIGIEAVELVTGCEHMQELADKLQAAPLRDDDSPE